MRRRRLISELLLSYLAIALVSVAAVSWYSWISLKNFQYDETESALEARAMLLEERFTGLVSAEARDEVNALARELGRSTATRITVILPSGQVIADSEEDPAAMENHADRPEIARAMNGDIGRSVRHSPTLGHDLMYVAVPAFADGEFVGVVRTSLPIVTLSETTAEVRGRMILAAAIVAALAALIGLLVSRAITRPIEEMKRGALRFAHGGFGYRVFVPRTEELASLAETLNRMAAELEERIETITRQRAEQEAVFESMDEGVIAVDPGERIIALNAAAAEMFGVDASSEGRTLQEVIRNTELQAFAAETLASADPVQGDIGLRRGELRHIRAHGTSLRDSSGNEVGAVIVLNDVTDLIRAEAIRRDFVANVSHELRTPVTSIKGFVETLLDGAVDEPAEARRFLDIVSRHTDRLNAIIEDLLYLSRIEQNGGVTDVILEEGPVVGVLRAAVEAVEPQANAKGIPISIDAPADLRARMSPALLGHAVVNLLDNAVKYSDKGSPVLIQAVADGDDVLIAVVDRGCGIEAKHLPRLFERFYRVDRARSRELGGTGLGLAIAKHIAQAHGGSISVESAPNHGSRFEIRIPRT